MIADICVFACTGKVGVAVARGIIELATSPITLLLSGRNIAKVQEVRTKLLAEAKLDANVKIVAHLESVCVDDDEALRNMVTRARVVANCIDTKCHPRALAGVAEACGKAGVHYLDLAFTRGQLQSLFSLNEPIERSRMVPASGFDYAFTDVSVFQAERAFAERFVGTMPDKVQLTLAVRTGPLGIKWPLRLVKKYVESESKPSRSVAPSHQAPSTRQKSRSGSVLAYIKPLSSWSIRWPFGGDAITFLLCQRQWLPDSVDARLALPRTLWKAAVLAVYGVVAAAIFIPLLGAARYLKIEAFQKLILWLIPIGTLGFFSNDDDMCRSSTEQMRIELVVMLRNNKGLSLCYHVVGPSPEILNQLCMALSSLELALMSSGKRGILTPAMAMGETDFWSRLQNASKLKVQITEPIL